MGITLWINRRESGLGVIYAFRCLQGHECEREFPMGEAPERVECECGDAAERVFSVGGIRFNGADFNRKSR